VTDECRYCGTEIKSLKPKCGFAQANKALKRHQARCSLATKEERVYFLEHQRWPSMVR